MNRLVARLLRSRAHRLLSARVQLIEYRGRRSGRSFATPTQYVELGEDRVAIVVGRPDQKRWWRNFREPWPVRLLVRGTWRSMEGRSRWRRDDPTLVDHVVDRFREKYGTRGTPTPGSETLVVICHPA